MQKSFVKIIRAVNMNKKIFFITLSAIANMGMVNNVLAQASYVFPAGALGCADCHVGTGKQTFVPGILETFPIDQSLSVLDKMKAIHALTDAQRAPAFATIKAMLNPPATAVDTNPVVHPVNSKWDVTVGEAPLVIPVYVSDAENDAFDTHGNGLTVSPIAIDNATGLPKFTLTWSPTATQAGYTYPVTIFVKETERSAGRILTSNTVLTKVKIWPARANAATAQVSQFVLQAAKWKKNTLNLEGQIVFKSTVTAAQQAAALATLSMTLTTSKTATPVGSPMPLTVDATGKWKQAIPLNATQVPCSVVADYEGLKAERPVLSAPRATCLK